MEHDSNNVKRARPRTTAAIVSAAARLFVERGYVATTVEAIAVEAGVAVQTIYNAVGQKRDVLAAVVDAALSGEAAPRSPRETIGDQIAATSDPREVIRIAAAFWLQARTRTEDVFRVVREAAAVDPEVAAFERATDLRRFESHRQAAAEIDARGPLRDGLRLEDAAAAIWTLSHPVAWRLLTFELGWSSERYAAWLEDVLAAALLGAPPARRSARRSPGRTAPDV